MFWLLSYLFSHFFATFIYINYKAGQIFVFGFTSHQLLFFLPVVMLRIIGIDDNLKEYKTYIINSHLNLYYVYGFMLVYGLELAGGILYFQKLNTVLY